MTLILQILLLAIGVGGAIVTAITLSDPVWRRRCVMGFGLMGFVGLILTVATYEETPGLLHFRDAWGCLLSSFNEIRQKPSFWVVAAFASGLAIGVWLVPFALKRIKEGLIGGPIVKAWLTPLEAIEKFVSPDLLLEDKRARERVEMLATKIGELKIAREPNSDALEDVTVQLNDAKLVAKNRHYAVMESLRVQLHRGQLVAKGFKVNKGKIKKRESNIKPVFWVILLESGHTLDPEKRTASNAIFGNYQNVSIGKNEAMRK